MGLYREQGIVLRTYRLGETDRIVHLAAQDRGKVRAVAKGARRPGSRFAGRLEVFCHVDLLLYEGRNLDVVTQAELIEPYLPLREDHLLHTCAAAMAEATDRVVQEGERNLRVFLLLRAGLAALAARPTNPATFLHAFLVRLLAAAGFELSTSSCARCGGQAVPASLHVPSGGVVCRRCAPPGARVVDERAVAELRLLASGDWVDLADRVTSPEVAAFVQASVEHHLERPLRSYALVPRQ